MRVRGGRGARPALSGRSGFGVWIGGAFWSLPLSLVVVAMALACCGCESSQQQSARLEKAAKHEALALRGVSVTAESPSVRVLQSTVVRSGEATAVVVTLLNTS